MKYYKIFALTISIFITLIPDASAGNDERIDTNLHKYSYYRKILMKKGMKPNNNYAVSTGATNNDGSPMYDFAEVVCGNRICNVEWYNRNGRSVGYYFNRD